MDEPCSTLSVGSIGPRVAHPKDTMDDQRPSPARTPRSLDALYRELVGQWQRELRGLGFTEQQAARLIFAKMLYTSGRLRG